MKFTKLLVLLPVTSLAYTIKRDSTNSMQTDGNPNLNGVDPLMNTPECQNLSKAIDKCFGDMGGNPTSEAGCDKFHTEDCQVLLKQDLNACGNNFGIDYGSVLSTLKFGCAKNESGNYCPQLRFILEDKLTDSELNDICKSKSCTEKALEGLGEMKSITIELTDPETVAKELPFLDKFINTLTDEKCKATYSASSTNTTSNNSTAPNANTASNADAATKIKIGSVLLTTLAIALNLLY